MKKTFAKFGGLIASLALIAALAFTLAGCTSPEKLVEKLTAEDASYTVEMTVYDVGETQSINARVVGKEFYTKTTNGSEAEYSGLIKENSKYYMIVGDDDELLKTEIDQEKFNKLAEDGIHIRSSIDSLKNFKEYYVKGDDGKYKIDPEKLLDYYNSNIPEGLKLTELPAEEKTQLEAVRIEFDGGKIIIASTDAAITFSDIGSTKLTPYTDKAPIKL